MTDEDGKSGETRRFARGLEKGALEMIFKNRNAGKNGFVTHPHEFKNPRGESVMGRDRLSLVTVLILRRRGFVRGIPLHHFLDLIEMDMSEFVAIFSL